MKPPRRLRFRKLSALLALLAFAAPVGALAPGEWRHQQTVEVPAAGLVRMDLPPATLSAARPGLEDLRILDAGGNEVPFLIERPAPQPATLRRAESFFASLEASATKVTVETGMIEPVGGVTLETPANDFIKAVRVEGSQDGGRWQELAADRPVFRLPGGAARLEVEFPPARWKLLRLTLDDRRAEAVPITGVQVHGEKIASPTEPVAVTIKSRDESPGITRLALDLGAANLRLATIEIETAEPLFTRAVTVAVPEVTEEGIREQPIAEGVVHRIALESATAAQLSVEIEKQVGSRELVLLVRNQDSPPLAITSVRATRRPTRMTFLARAPGSFRILTGNNQCPAPRYDVAALSDRLKGAEAMRLAPSPLADNPEFRAPEALPGVAESSAPLDVSDWKRRKPVQLTQPGAQQLELDLEVLSRASPGFADLRLVRDARQFPYLLERTSIARAITPVLAPSHDPKKPRLSRWSLKLPQPALPLTRLACTSGTALFERELRLWEEVPDERGDKYPRELGRATWRRTPGRPAVDLVLEFAQKPATDSLLLETDNGDNPPIDVNSARAWYPVTRLVFKTAAPADPPFRLYYDNRQANPGRYDLSLVAPQLLAAEKSIATLGPEEGAKKSAWLESESLSGPRRILFWAALTAVVLGLLLVLARLLPKATPPDQPA
ncbi:MAG: hypothetical protein QOE70_5080 [Chthoniobacter sp.]|jgi:hypothetical protein|nr:hypothetical protein [Chthoniobacter sp.]